MKKYLGLIPVAIFAILLGCGGGGGGGSSSNGNTNNSTTGFTSGDTTASASSTIIGQVVNRNGGAPIANVTVRFLTSSNTLVGSATSRANGYFDANIPTTATKFEVDPTTVPVGFNNAFQYGNVWLHPTINPCRYALPTITPGVLTPMSSGQFRYLAQADGTPPVPPGGCSL